MSSFRIYFGEEFLGDRELIEDMVIGRHKSCDLTLDMDGISRKHARLIREEDGFYVEDLGSVNGTFVDSHQLEKGKPHKLSDREEVALGRDLYILKIRMDAADEPEGGTVLDGPESAAVESEAVEPEAVPPPEPRPLMQHLVEGLANIPVWSEGTWKVVVQEVVEETGDARTFRMVGRDPLLFSYMPGQFITIQVEIDGEPEFRSYTISSTPSRPHALEITVKRVLGGKISNWLHDNVQKGDELTIIGPSGSFSCFSYPSKKLLFIGAGSGATPIMSMSRWIVDTAADVDVKFLVSARTPSDIIFRKDLEMLAARHRNIDGAVTVTSNFAATESWLGLRGRVSLDMIKMVCPDFMDRHIFMCGPAPFMAAVTEILSEANYPLDHLHTESFGEGRVAEGTLPKGTESIDETMKSVEIDPGTQIGDVLEAGGCTVNFQQSNLVRAGDPGVPILQLAEQVGAKIPYSCRSGACGQCKVKLVDGTVIPKEDAVQRVANLLPEGFVLSCVDCPDGPITVDA
ncbi:MAG: FHA domain-containing protein [Planctomycetota bacterium]